MQRMVYATVKAFGGGQAQAQQTEEDEPVIDTTNPDFVKNFKGFTGMPGQQSRPIIPQNTEILFG